MIVGGLIDDTAGTLSAPDLDINIEWELDEKLAGLLVIKPTDEGESGQYTVQVNTYLDPDTLWQIVADYLFFLSQNIEVKNEQHLVHPSI